ncbi:hypothetical protein ACEPAH_5422 [Sanghuangporus vaninii]
MEQTDDINPWRDPDPKTENNPLAVTKAPPPDLLLFVFIHGFKGTDSTFGGFPERLRHIVAETITNVNVECIVFPAYETKGELSAAVERFVDWLTTLTVEREVANGSGGGAGKAKIVLCGHSMGGLVAADSLIGMVNSRPDKLAPLWPKVIACIAFDTPYLGLHPFVFKNSVSKAFGYAKTAQQVASTFNSLFANSTRTASAASAAARPPAGAITAPSTSPSSSSWTKWAVPAAAGLGGLLLSGAAAGVAYYKKEDIVSGYTWATDHMKYVGTLWDQPKLKERLTQLVEIEKNLGVTFRNFYTLLPYHPGKREEQSTFIILPSANSPLRSHFLFSQNNLADNEIEAHMGMFEPATNDSYYGLGLEMAKIIREAMASSRGVVSQESAPGDVNGSTEHGTTAT